MAGRRLVKTFFLFKCYQILLGKQIQTNARIHLCIDAHVSLIALRFQCRKYHLDKNSELLVKPSFVGDLFDVLGLEVTSPYVSSVFTFHVDDQTHAAGIELTDLYSCDAEDVLNLKENREIKLKMVG